MNVYAIAARPRRLARIAQAIYDEIRNGHDWGKAFPDAWRRAVDGLTECSPREMRRVMINAFGNAKLGGRDEIALADVGENRAARKQRIGF